MLIFVKRRENDLIMAKTTQSYKYIKENAIISPDLDDYCLSIDEYYRIYSFYVTYSMCGNQSAKKRSFQDYGWDANTIKGVDGAVLKKALKDVLDLTKAETSFVFAKDDNLKELFTKYQLEDAPLTDIERERAVIVSAGGTNRYLNLFYRIRDGFAHGLFNLRYSTKREKMVVIEDHDQYNVTARIVIKLDTLIQFVYAIDRNGKI